MFAAHLLVELEDLIIKAILVVRVEVLVRLRIALAGS